MSLRWTQDQLAEYMTRTQKPLSIVKKAQPDEGPESKLQERCIHYCRDHGFPVFHDWSRKKNQSGWPDLFVFVKDRVVLVELKAANGRLRKEQRELKLQLNWLGHTVHIVRSFVGFVEVING